MNVLSFFVVFFNFFYLFKEVLQEQHHRVKQFVKVINKLNSRHNQAKTQIAWIYMYN